LEVKLAFVFPGQGSQYIGMGRALAIRFSSAQKAFDSAGKVLGFDVSSVCWEDPDRLCRTEYTQPAVLAVEIACLAVLADLGVSPAVVAGHSLGEYAALVAAGSLDAADALRLVRSRGEITGKVASRVDGGMAAILGMDRGSLEELLAAAGAEGVIAVSNYNCPGQVVVSGEAPAIDEVLEVAPSLGAKRARRLAVAGPFHCPMMETAAREFEPLVARVDIGAPLVPVISNYDARAHTGSEAIAGNLVRQLCNPVRWEESVARISTEGVDLFVEVGPGTVLSGLVRRCLPGSATISVEDPDSFAGLLNLLEEGAGSPAAMAGGR